MNNDNIELGGGLQVPLAAPITPVEGQDGSFQTVPDVTTSLALLIGGGSSPQMSASAWGGECSFALTLLSRMPVLPPPGKKIPPQDLQAVQLSGAYQQDMSTQAVAWQGVDRSSSFTSVAHSDDTPEGSLEFDVTLQSRPVDDRIVFQLDFDNVNFYRQPFMFERIGEDGIVTADDTNGYDARGNIIHQCPENIPGSYAVYHADPPRNYEGGTIYKTGKIGHLYRPLITDADGNTVWGRTTVDQDSGLLTIDIPSDFLDRAIYPIIVDPTFGYTTAGGSSATLTYPVCHVGSGLIHAASANEQATLFSVYGSGGGCDAALYTIVGGVPVGRLAAAVAIALPVSAGWGNSAALAQVMTNGVTYGTATGNYATATLYYDVTTGNQRSAETRTGALQTPWSSASLSASQYSWYTTYANYWPVSQTDSGSAISTQSVIATRLADVSETRTASDTLSSTSIKPVSVSETATSIDTVSCSYIGRPSQADAGSATDTPSTTYIGRPVQVDSGSATDAPSAVTDILADTDEPGSANDSTSAIYTGVVSTDEPATGDDLTSSTFIGVVSILEAANGNDNPDTIEQQVENISATDTEDATYIALTNTFEPATALDSQDATIDILVAITEPTSAEDTCVVGEGLTTGVTIHYAVEIFTDTTFSDSTMGIVDGVFRFVTDQPYYEGSIIPKYGVNEIDVDGVSIGGDDVLSWFYQGYLLKDSITSNPRRSIDIVSSGNYSTESQFSFAISNVMKFLDYCQTNNLALTGKRVVLWVVINDIFYQQARGRIKNSPYTETDFIFDVDDDATLIHSNIPPSLSVLDDTSASGPKVTQGDPVPIVFGNVPYSKILKNNADNYVLPLNSPYLPAAATDYTISGTDYYLTLYSSTVFTADDSRLVGMYLYVVAATISQVNSVVDRIYKILSNTASSSGLVVIKLDSPLVKSSSGDGSTDILIDPAEFNNVSWHHCLTGTPPNYVSTVDTWWFQISDYSQASYVSTKSVTVSDILEYDSSIKAYGSVASLLNLVSTPAPTIKLKANTGTKDGKVTQYERLNITLAGFGTTDYADNVNPVDYTTAPADIAEVTDKRTATYIDFYTGLSLGQYNHIIADFTPQPMQPASGNQVLSGSYSALYFCIDYQLIIANADTILQGGVYLYVTDLTDSIIYYGPAQLVADGFAYSGFPAIARFDFIPDPLMLDTSSSIFGAKAQVSSGKTYRACVKIPDADPSIFTSPQVKKIRMFFGVKTLNQNYTVRIREICLVGEKSVDTLKADLFARTQGEKLNGGSTQTNTVYTAFRHILEDYDGIPSALIDYGTLAADRSSWPISRTLTEQRNSVDYLNELCAHSFVGMFSGRTGKRVLRVFQGFTGALTPTTGNGKTSVHDGFLIVKDSISSYERSSAEDIYNSFLLQYCFDPGSNKFIRSFNVAHVEETAFPLSSTPDPDDSTIPLWWSYFSGLPTSVDDWTISYNDSKTIWDICHASYLLNGAVKLAQGDISQLNWFSDTLIWSTTDTSGTGTTCSAYLLLLLLARWCTLQKDIVTYSIPINSFTCETELLDVVCFIDTIYTNDANAYGWITGIEMDASKDQYNLTVLLQPKSLV